MVLTKRPTYGHSYPPSCCHDMAPRLFPIFRIATQGRA